VHSLAPGLKYSGCCFNRSLTYSGDDPVFQLLRTGGVTSAETWTAPDLEWSNPGTPLPDIADFGVRAVIDPVRNPGLAHILSKSGPLLPPGGDATGRVVHIPSEITQLKDLDRIVGDWGDSPRRPTSNSDISLWAFHEDQLPMNTMVREMGLARSRVRMKLIYATQAITVDVEFGLGQERMI